MNKRLRFLPILSAFLAGVLSLSAADRPNILYLYVDDMGWGSIGPNGQAARRAANKPSVRTPNLDRLAAGGVNFLLCSLLRNDLVEVARKRGGELRATFTQALVGKGTRLAEAAVFVVQELRPARGVG